VQRDHDSHHQIVFDRAPCPLAGTWLGLKLFGRLDEAAFRRGVLVLLLVSGIVLMV